jgi:hypothetical protein
MSFSQTLPDDLQNAVENLNLELVDLRKIEALGQLALASMPSSMLPISPEAEGKSYTLRWHGDPELDRLVDMRMRQGRGKVFKISCQILHPLLYLSKQCDVSFYTINEVLLRAGVRIENLDTLVVADSPACMSKLLHLSNPKSLDRMEAETCRSVKARRDVPREAYDVVIALVHATDGETLPELALLSRIVLFLGCARKGAHFILHIKCTLNSEILASIVQLALRMFAGDIFFIKPSISKKSSKEIFMVAKCFAPPETKTLSQTSLSVWLLQLEEARRSNVTSGELSVFKPVEAPFKVLVGVRFGLDLLDRLMTMQRQGVIRKALQMVRIILGHRTLVRETQLLTLQDACSSNMVLQNLARSYMTNFPLPSNLKVDPHEQKWRETFQ